MQYIPAFYEYYAIQVPPWSGDPNPTNSLLKFLNKHSRPESEEDKQELQGVYYDLSQDAILMFECRLKFRRAELSIGRGDTKKRAREEAVRRVLRTIREALGVVLLGSPVALEDLVNRFGNRQPR